MIFVVYRWRRLFTRVRAIAVLLPPRVIAMHYEHCILCRLGHLDDFMKLHHAIIAFRSRIILRLIFHREIANGFIGVVLLIAAIIERIYVAWLRHEMKRSTPWPSDLRIRWIMPQSFTPCIIFHHKMAWNVTLLINRSLDRIPMPKCVRIREAIEIYWRWSH